MAPASLGASPDLGPIFIDVEASALVRGYPIEVGWATANAPSGAVSVSSVLINPSDTSWASEFVWDPKAEALHGVTATDLVANGMRPSLVAKLVAAELGGRVVYSDNPQADGRWIDMLYAQAASPRPFTVAQRAATALIAALADARGMGDLDYTAAEQEARRRAGQRHRAGPDAAYWAHLWLLIEEGFRAPAGTRPKFGPLRRKPI